MSEQALWYVAHTYSGYENKVKANLEKTVDNRNMRDIIQEVKVPVEEVIEYKDNKSRTTLRKIYPGYVMVKMIMTDESWYVVRNTRGVTGFVGPGSKPIPLTEEEVVAMGVEGAPPRIRMAFEIGDEVRITEGTMINQKGRVDAIDAEQGKARIIIQFAGRETPVDLDITSVSKA